MMKLVAVLALAAAGTGGWWYLNQPPVPAAAPEISPLAQPEPAHPPQPALPAAAAQALATADAAWNKAGADPAASAQAPELNRLYAAALRSLSNVPQAAAREQQLVQERLTPLGAALFFTKTPYPTDSQFGTHTVAPGENPEAIAKRYGMSRELLNRLRGKDVNDANLRVGDVLKVIRLKEQTDPVRRGNQIRIDKGDYVLDLFIGGLFVKRYPIAHGAAVSPTPVGTTFVTNRMWHPDWTHPVTKKVIRYGEPDHLLGPVWLAFDAKGLGKSGIGIHGYTGTDAKMGVMASNGCIRLENPSAEELYQLVSHPDRTPITVEIAE